ncbi:nucleotidyltransferase domain-containing protein [Antrihabitans cavernicola]|uniref:ArsR family transcriptional regulator n=1 Tax=Antrihabitans cavernicola TaxID=2495913 RepID=A0A5A7SB76_9NOCA|nr:nucleotidyltransferase domain-containing protein [Spelaeibacter cavernicola]KAA0022549.1 ArsR family transcriptional regulator [Spelaeibacter cavernicola]
MTLIAEYLGARQAEDAARLRRAVALRAMVSTGRTQRDIADALGISQPAVSQQLKAAPDLRTVHPEVLVEAAAPILDRLAAERGFTRLAVFGSVARGQARADSDIDLLVEPPAGTTIGTLLALRELFEIILERSVDLVTYGGLKPKLDDDIRGEAVLLG